MKRIKRICALALTVLFMIGFTTTVHAVPAPSLTAVTISDVTLDENDKVYIEVTEMGTSKSRLVYCNNELLKENVNEIVSLDI